MIAVPNLQVRLISVQLLDVDGRDEPGHDDEEKRHLRMGYFTQWS